MAEETPAEVTAEEVTVEAAPDLFEPFIACRSWIVNKEGPVPGDDGVYVFEGSIDAPWRLWSTNQTDVFWEAGENNAECRTRRGYPGHGVPYEGCACGFYALADWGKLFAEHPAMRPSRRENSFRIYGTVELMGKVIPATQGYRAARASVRSLLLPQFPIFGNDRLAKRKQAALLRSMQRVVRRTAETYGVPVMQYLEELSVPFHVKEAKNEHRGGAGSGYSGTLTGTGQTFFGTSTGTGTGASFSITQGASTSVSTMCARCGVTWIEDPGVTYRHNCWDPPQTLA